MTHHHTLPGGQYAAGWEGLFLFIALARMVALRMKVMVYFWFGRFELALIRPERKHNSRAKPSILSKGFFWFLSCSQ